LFVASVIQHTVRMYHIVICGLPDCAIFVHIISQSLDFRKKKKIVHEMRVFILSTILSETFLILCRNEWDKVKNVCWFLCKIPVIISRF